MHIVSLVAPSNPASQANTNTHIPSSMRRIRVAGALPFPLQQQHHSLFQKKTAELQHQQSGRSNNSSGVSSRSHDDATASAVARPMEFSIISGVLGVSDNLWSMPSVAGGNGDVNIRKIKGSSGVGDVLMFKKPPVTTVLPFENEKPLPQQQTKKGLRPSTYR